MRLVILDDYDLSSEWAAKYIRNRIIQFKPSADRYFTLGLPTGKLKVTNQFPMPKTHACLMYVFSLTNFWKFSTLGTFWLLYKYIDHYIIWLFAGSTPLGCYKKLIEYHKNGDLSFKFVKTFNMDEYVGEWTAQIASHKSAEYARSPETLSKHCRTRAADAAKQHMDNAYNSVKERLHTGLSSSSLSSLVQKTFNKHYSCTVTFSLL